MKYAYAVQQTPTLRWRLQLAAHHRACRWLAAIWSWM
jgi:hypothetical protein